MTSQIEKGELSALAHEIAKMTIIPEQPLLTSLHQKYVLSILKNLRKAIIHFDCNQPWLHYYISHCLNILRCPLSQRDIGSMKKALGYCDNGRFGGGFGGGHGQLAHLASTYAAFLAIIELGPQAYSLIDRERLLQLFRRCKVGSQFMMHQKGEIDLRAAYIVCIIVKILKLDESVLEGVGDVILSSQTYEGGISNVIGGEAHGGFTFCGVAALAILKQLHFLDISRLSLWLSQRQLELGGFNGRTNKLIDSCYSHWVGNIHNILNSYFQGEFSIDEKLLYDQALLQKYVLIYCQDTKQGGLRDKPGKGIDIYHTCYALSGFSGSQEFGLVVNGSPVEPIDPIYNVTAAQLRLIEAHLWK